MKGKNEKMFETVKRFISNIWLKYFNQSNNKTSFYLEAPKYIKENVDINVVLKEILLTCSEKDITKLDEKLIETFFEDNCEKLEYNIIKKFPLLLQCKYRSRLSQDIQLQLVADWIISKEVDVRVSSYDNEIFSILASKKDIRKIY